MRSHWTALAISAAVMALYWAGCRYVPAPLTAPVSTCTQSGDCPEGYGCIEQYCLPTSRGVPDQPSPDLRGPSDDAPDRGPDAGSEPPGEGGSDAAPEGGDGTPETPGCTPGTSQSCYGGPANTQGVGICKAGEQFCTSQRVWSACIGQQLPQKELCNGQDDDCNGKVDDSFPEKDQPCTDVSQKGPCQRGVYVLCDKGSLKCESNTKPATKETCGNKIDDDCNGQVDDTCACDPNTSEPCGLDRGECKRGTRTCTANAIWGPCENAITPKIEVCDGKDNNCDGNIDEFWPTLGSSCSGQGVGECKGQGTFVCSDDMRTVKCDAKPTKPEKELCDGKDNDCDGKIDEELLRDCYSGPPGTQDVGECKKGSQLCIQGQWEPCNELLPKAEKCDGKDNDCNGKADDNVPGLGSPCRRGTGKCEREGVESCVNGAVTCALSMPLPVEQCRNNKDDDCDGKVDEICGPSFAYGILEKDGTATFERGIQRFTGYKSYKTGGRGVYGFTATDALNGCSAHGVITRPFVLDLSLSTQYCGGASYYVKTYQVRKSSGEDRKNGFVLPKKATGAYFGVVSSCAGPRCLFFSNSRYGFGVNAATKAATGVYKIDAPPCKGTNPPIFVSTTGSSLGYATAESKGGFCYVYTFSAAGQPTDKSFFVWLPRKDQVAWAIVDSAQAAKGYILDSNTFNKPGIQWKATLHKNSATEKVYELTFPAWTKDTLILVTPRTDQAVGLGVKKEDKAKGYQVRSLKITDFKPTTSESFYVMFVQ